MVITVDNLRHLNLLIEIPQIAVLQNQVNNIEATLGIILQELQHLKFLNNQNQQRSN